MSRRMYAVLGFNSDWFNRREIVQNYKLIGLIKFSQLPFFAALLALDWGDWIYGLTAAVITGGASSVASGFSLIVVAPDQFNMVHPGLLIKSMLTMFFVNGMLAGFSFLRNKPVPTMTRETTYTIAETTQTGQPTKVVTTTQEKTTRPADAAGGAGVH